MSNFPEIPCNTIKNITQPDKSVISYRVRKFGINDEVFEEELIPIPTIKIVKTMNVDGTEDMDKRREIPIVPKDIGG